LNLEFKGCYRQFSPISLRQPCQPGLLPDIFYHLWAKNLRFAFERGVSLDLSSTFSESILGYWSGATDAVFSVWRLN
jgi:hypothetical protein